MKLYLNTCSYWLKRFCPLSHRDILLQLEPGPKCTENYARLVGQLVP